MSTTIAIAAFSFGLVEKEPGKCNIRLAKAVKHILAAQIERGNKTIILAQWEIALWLKSHNIDVTLSIEPLADEHYLGSEEVWEQMKSVARAHNITQVIPVVERLQRIKVQKLIKADGFQLLPRRVGWVGFDRSSTQWWTRGPLQLLYYAVRQKFAGLHGTGKQQSAA